jgi:hypothetical protein
MRTSAPQPAPSVTRGNQIASASTTDDERTMSYFGSATDRVRGVGMGFDE